MFVTQLWICVNKAKLKKKKEEEEEEEEA